MSKQVKSDGRVQKVMRMVFDYGTPNRFTNEERAKAITYEHLRCCDLKTIEDIYNACSMFDILDRPCGDGDMAVRGKLEKFIEIRKKQSPTYHTKPTQIDDAEIRELLAEACSPEPKLVRRPGMATPEEGLRKWVTEKVASEIPKQIRRDFGGKGRDESILCLAKQLGLERYISSTTARATVAISVYDLLGKQIEGCRKRVASKVEELKRRAERGDSAARTDS